MGVAEPRFETARERLIREQRIEMHGCLG